MKATRSPSAGGATSCGRAVVAGGGSSICAWAPREARTSAGLGVVAAA